MMKKENGILNDNCIRIECVNLINNDFFTKDRLSEWRVFIAKCCRDICDSLITKVDPKFHVTYFVNEALIQEIIGDAVIGMSKIIDKTPHPIEHPNAFKIAAYLGYWFLRYKPVSVIYPFSKVDLNHISVASNSNSDPKYLIWNLKHINELIAVNIVTNYIFDFDTTICSQRHCMKIKKKNIINGESTFEFDSFEQQRKIMTQKLTYYFAYRAIAPKIIEHILEGYAFHPAWKLTGAHWKTNLLATITNSDK